MPKTVRKFDGLLRLENIKYKEKKLLIIDYNDLELLQLLCDGLLKSNVSNIEIWQSVEKDYGLTKYVPRREMDYLLELYRIYDFTDSISFISETSQYGSLFNYLKTGILTKQEMVDALLSKI